MLYLIKAVGAVFIMLSGIVLSSSLCAADEKNINSTEALLSIVKFTKNQIDCFGIPIGEIFKRCDRELLGKCSVYITPTSFDEFISDAELSDEAEKIITAFSSEFGSSYRDGQLKNCDYCIARLSECLAAQKEDYKKNKKLYRAICLSAAIGIIILAI